MTVIDSEANKGLATALPGIAASVARDNVARLGLCCALFFDLFGGDIGPSLGFIEVDAVLPSHFVDGGGGGWSYGCTWGHAALLWCSFCAFFFRDTAQ